MPYLVAGMVEAPEQLIARSPETFREKQRIDVRTRHEVVEIDPARKRVRVRNLDEALEFWEDWDDLLIATGASPIEPDVPNASAEGSLSDYLTIVSSDDPAIALINGDLTIGGDSRLLQQLQRLLGELDIDWEAPIAAVTGDIVGHQIGRSLRGILAWGKTSKASIERQLKEFIIEEARLSPSEAELCDFYDDIRRLQQTIDRVDAKIKRLSRRRNPV
jgi:hypothetical protein